MALLDGFLVKNIFCHFIHLGMENHLEEQVMVRNCCLSLCQVNKFKNINNVILKIKFDIPQEILFNYGRVANLLINVLKTHNSDA